MKQVLAATVLALTASTAASADVTKEDILKLSNAGISEDVIINFIRKNAPVRDLDADDLVELKKKGVGDRVLAELTAKPAKASPAPAPSRPPRSTVVTEWRTPVNYYYTSSPAYSCTIHRTYGHCYSCRPRIGFTYSTYTSPYIYGSWGYRPYVYRGGWYGYGYGSWCR